jgi:hypothetical protein
MKIARRWRLFRKVEQHEVILPACHHKERYDNNLFPSGSNWSRATGLSKDQLNLVTTYAISSILKEEENIGHKSRPRYLSVGASVAVFCEFLKTGQSALDLARKYGVSLPAMKRTIEWMAIHLRASLDTIELPEELWSAGRFDTAGAIDCSVHRRNKVHPMQDSFYCYDKRCHFLASQVIVDHLGCILRVVIGRGHNNDQGMFNLSDVESMLVDKKVSLLTDLGYARRGCQIVRPIAEEDCEYDIAAQVFNRSQASERAKVEHAISWWKKWKFAANHCQYPPQFQAICLIITAQLQQLTYVPNAYARCASLERSQRLGLIDMGEKHFR